MPTVHPLLREATQRGYVIKRTGETNAWKLFHNWCSLHAQPFVYIDITKNAGRGTTAIVGIDLFTTRGRGHLGERFTPAALAEAQQMLAHYPLPMNTRIAGMITSSPLAIRHSRVPVDQAEPLAQALLALYQRMNENTGV